MNPRNLKGTMENKESKTEYPPVLFGDQWETYRPLWEAIGAPKDRVLEIIDQMDLLKSEMKMLTTQSIHAHKVFWDTVSKGFPITKDKQCEIHTEPPRVEMRDKTEKEAKAEGMKGSMFEGPGGMLFDLLKSL